MSFLEIVNGHINFTIDSVCLLFMTILQCPRNNFFSTCSIKQIEFCCGRSKVGEVGEGANGGNYHLQNDNLALPRSTPLIVTLKTFLYNFFDQNVGQRYKYRCHSIENQ